MGSSVYAITRSLLFRCLIVTFSSPILTQCAHLHAHNVKWKNACSCTLAVLVTASKVNSMPYESDQSAHNFDQCRDCHSIQFERHFKRMHCLSIQKTSHIHNTMHFSSILLAVFSTFSHIFCQFSVCLSDFLISRDLFKSKMARLSYDNGSTYSTYVFHGI